MSDNQCKAHFLPGNTYKTKNGFNAYVGYRHNEYLIGHIASECGFSTFLWTGDGIVLAADCVFDLVPAPGEGE